MTCSLQDTGVAVLYARARNYRQIFVMSSWTEEDGLTKTLLHIHLAFSPTVKGMTSQVLPLHHYLTIYPALPFV